MRLTDSRRENDFMSKKNNRTKKGVVKTRGAAAVRVQPLVRPLPPGEQEISDKRDDAAKVTGEERDDTRRQDYASGVRDALAWVLGDSEDGLEV